MTGLIVSHRLASLGELQTVYSYEDALDMSEVIQVNNYNEDLLYREALKKAEHARR